MSRSTTEANRAAWNTDRFQAWVDTYGEPLAAARALAVDPRRPLRRLLPHLGEVAGRRIVNVQGSHGRIAVALGLLGAQPVVIDFAEENQRYAQALAAAAGVALDYHVSDIMAASALGLAPADVVVLELGVLHYHQDLQAFFRALADLAKPGGRLVLNEFHPVQRKLHWPDGPRDYFAAGVVEAPVPDPTGEGRLFGSCAYRFWTLGEIVSSVLAAGFRLLALEEHPDWDTPSIPGTFTLVGERTSAAAGAAGLSPTPSIA